MSYSYHHTNFNFFKFLLKPFLFIYYKKNNIIYKITIKIIAGLLISFLLYAIISVFLQFERMNSSTMEYTIRKNDFIVISKVKYAIEIKPFISKLTGKTFIFSKPKRGDIVLLIDPKSKKESSIKNFISFSIYFFTLGKVNISETKYIVKRVIGLPNETIEIRDKAVYINGILLNEPWININENNRTLNAKISTRDNLKPYIIGYNEYFVMSDNRDYGYDSRDFGNINFSHIIGKVISK